MQQLTAHKQIRCFALLACKCRIHCANHHNHHRYNRYSVTTVFILAVPYSRFSPWSQDVYAVGWKTAVQLCSTVSMIITRWTHSHFLSFPMAILVANWLQVCVKVQHHGVGSLMKTDLVTIEFIAGQMMKLHKGAPDFKVTLLKWRPTCGNHIVVVFSKTTVYGCAQYIAASMIISWIGGSIKIYRLVQCLNIYVIYAHLSLCRNLMHNHFCATAPPISIVVF